MQFMFFFFEPLRFERLVEQLEQSTYAHQSLRNLYLHWLDEFCRKSILFYQNQYRAHSELSWSEFCSKYEIPDYETPSNFDLGFEWESWKEEYLLNSHYDKYRDVIQTMSDLQNITNTEIRSNLTLPNSETILMREFDKIWFNNLINNPPQIITELKSLDYERYLQTAHWRRIRAAMFLINKAICQADECNVIGESWYGSSESGLDVHHLSYSNRGNERFDDLALLCRYHHKLTHNEQRDNERTYAEDMIDEEE